MAGNRANHAPYFWTRLDNVMLEHALVMYNKETPNRWEKVARAMGSSKTEAEVKAHYQFLVESGRIRSEEEVEVDIVDAPAPTAPNDASSSSSAPAMKLQEVVGTQDYESLGAAGDGEANMRDLK